MIEAILTERRERGPFGSLRDFIQRLSGKEVNKRTVESFIKSGALDSLGGTRKQLMQVYASLIDQTAREKKSSVTGQMSLFDLLGEEEKKEYEIQLPPVGEFEKEQLLAFEKEVLGIYVSGHPLEKYEALWKRGISNVTTDFQLDEETGQAKVTDQAKVTVGGMITGKTVKYTKTNKTMAFLTLEDLVGTVEVVVFPKDYETYGSYLKEENKIFVRGRVSSEDDKASKVICERIWGFDEVPRELWVQFSTMEAYRDREDQLFALLRQSDGKDHVAIYVRSPRAVRRLGDNWTVRADEELLSRLEALLGKENVKVK